MLKRAAIILLGGLCFFTISCDQIEKKKQEKEALRAITRSKNEMMDSAVITEEGLNIDAAKIKSAQQTLKKSGEKIGGKLGEAMTIAADLQLNLNEMGEKCSNAADEACRAFDLKSLSATRDYKGSIERFKALISVNEETLATFRAFQPDLVEKLNAIGFTGEERKGFDDGFGKKWVKTSQLVNTIRNADIELGKIGILVMEGLQKGDAHWQWDDDAQQATFQTDAQVEWFNAHMERITKLSETQLKAQEDLVRHLKTP